jgi:hypothetical protein
MSQMPGDIGSFILAGHSPQEASRLANEYKLKRKKGHSSKELQEIFNKNPDLADLKMPIKPKPLPSQTKPEPKEDPTNPVSEVEGLTGVRMTKGQKWAAVIGITLALYGVTIYLNKK